MKRRTAVLSLALIAFVPTTAAQAATVELHPSYDTVVPSYIRDWVFTITAEPGEQNVLDVNVDSGTYTFTVTDTGAPLVAGTGCEESGDAVTCTGGATRAGGLFDSTSRIDVGDENDTVVANGISNYTVRDGSGDDDVRLVQLGRIIAGPGADKYSAASVSYEERTAGVNVSVDEVANDGESGEGDNVVAGDVIGSPRADILTGGPGPNQFNGSGGDDTLVGGDGDDSLTAVSGRAAGGTGDDRIALTNVQGPVTGDAGNDSITVRGDGTGEVAGGPGGDKLDMADRSLSLEFTPSVSISADGLANDGTGNLNVSGFETFASRRAWFIGTPGNDEAVVETGVADGGAGNDRLSGGAQLTGGPGADDITHSPTQGERPGAVFARDGEADRVNCGASQPSPLDLDPIDVVVGCVPSLGLATTVPRFKPDSKARITVPLRCQLPSQVPCTGEARISSGTLGLGRGTTGAVTPGAVKKVRMKLGSRARAALKRGRTVTATLVVDTRAFAGQSRTSSLGKITIKPPARRRYRRSLARGRSIAGRLMVDTTATGTTSVHRNDSAGLVRVRPPRAENSTR